MADAPIQLKDVNYYFGSGDLRKQILFEITTEVAAGEIVILTGPSGSGKTTVLTLAGALRTPQEGSVNVLGQELRGASKKGLVGVRRRIGYIFQLHNLLDSLTVSQNVQMSLQLQDGISAREMRNKAGDILEAVGLGDRKEHNPSQLSGGQKQRVAIARALVAEPRIVLADEPTASLDKQSGRDVVDLMQRLAKEQGVTVVLVTHDNRILDIADRIIHLEDGRLQSFSEAVIENTRQMMSTLADYNRKGEMARRVADMEADEFIRVLEHVTGEASQFLQVSRMASSEAFESMLDQALDAFTRKIGVLMDADRASLWLLDEQSGELWTKVAQDAGGEPFEIRIPKGTGIAGAVAASGEPLNIPDVYEDPRFDPTADKKTGYRTHGVLCTPLFDAGGRVFGVAQVLNKASGSRSFDAVDEKRFQAFAEKMGVILESWGQMASRTAGNGEAVASE
jgi:putative ABC transport system ATP-binding protein